MMKLLWFPVVLWGLVFIGQNLYDEGRREGIRMTLKLADDAKTSFDECVDMFQRDIKRCEDATAQSLAQARECIRVCGSAPESDPPASDRSALPQRSRSTATLAK